LGFLPPLHVVDHGEPTVRSADVGPIDDGQVVVRVRACERAGVRTGRSGRDERRRRHEWRVRFWSEADRQLEGNRVRGDLDPTKGDPVGRTNGYDLGSSIRSPRGLTGW
jgi:hypothetical protein